MNPSPTICIPRVETFVTKEYILKKFSKLNLGEITQITDIPLRSDNDYKCVFIKIKWNPITTQGKYVYTRLINGENVKIMYDPPWHWKIVASRVN